MDDILDILNEYSSAKPESDTDTSGKQPELSEILNGSGKKSAEAKRRMSPEMSALYPQREETGKKQQLLFGMDTMSFDVDEKLKKNKKIKYIDQTDPFDVIRTDGDKVVKQIRKEEARREYTQRLKPTSDGIVNRRVTEGSLSDEQKRSNTSVLRGLTSILGKIKEPEEDRLSFQDKNVRAIESGRKTTGNTEIIDNLMRINKERQSKTAAIPPINRKNIRDVDLKLDGLIIPDTEQIMMDKEVLEEEKLRELKERRSKKIKNFVLAGEEEENDEGTEDNAEKEKVITDFESFDDAPSVLDDILQLKGSLMIRFIVLLVTGLLCFYIALANDCGLPMPELVNRSAQPASYLFVNIILGILAAASSYTVISCGLAKLVKLTADCDTLAGLSIVSALVSAMISIANSGLVGGKLVNIYMAAAICALLFNCIGKLLIVGRTAKNFRYVSGDYDRYAVVTVDEETAAQFTRGTMNDFPQLAIMKRTEFISDFLKNSYSTDISDKLCRYGAPIAVGASLLIAVIAGFMGNASTAKSGLFIGLSVFSGMLAVCSCSGLLTAVHLPIWRASNKYLAQSAAMLSYESIEEFADTNSVMCDVSQLFPQGMISLSAIKVFSDTRIDEAIVQAASLTTQAGSILNSMFYDIIAGKTEMLNPVESYIYEDSMGLCGWINNKRVILGNRELMENHSIEGMPTKLREKEYTEKGKSAVYLSISGELSAMFIIEMKASLEVQKWLMELERTGTYLILRSTDSVVSITKLSELFDISPEMLKIIPFTVHPKYEEVTSYVPKQNASMVCGGRFSSLATLVIGAKRLKSTISLGVIVQAASAVLGILMGLALTLMSAFGELTPTLAVCYNLLWAAIAVIPGLFKKS